MDTASLTEFIRYTPDELSALYKCDPARFDELAAAAICEACIGKTPEQTIRLRQLQWSIDAQLRKAKTPLQRMQIMERIFYGRVYGAEGELAKLMHCCREVLQVIGGPREIPVRRPAVYLVKHTGRETESAGTT
jgi:hypothetical protein